MFVCTTYNCKKCYNKSCSHSQHQRTYSVSELVSSIIITDNCSEKTAASIHKADLTPSKFKILDVWTNNGS